MLLTLISILITGFVAPIIKFYSFEIFCFSVNSQSLTYCIKFQHSGVAPLSVTRCAITEFYGVATRLNEPPPLVDPNNWRA